MEFWDDVETFHKSVFLKHKYGEGGIEAVKYFRSVIEPYWEEEYSSTHPLRFELLTASDSQYFELQVMMHKLKVAEALNGYDGLEKRLAVPLEFLNAWSEIEMAFRFHVAGIHTEFVPTNPAENTPDILVESGSNKVWLEVTSANPESEDRVSKLTWTFFRLTFMRNVKIGGTVSNPGEFGKLKDFEKSVSEALDEAEKNNKVVMLNERGICTFYAYPEGLSSEVPEEIAGTIKVLYSGPRPHMERILRAIRDKGRKSYNKKGNWHLILIDRLMDDNEFIRVLASDTGEVPDVLATYPDILGMSIIVPTGINNPQVPWDAMKRPGRKYSVYVLPPFNTEAHIYWENRSCSTRMPAWFSEALERYERNLTAFLESKGLRWP